MGTTKTLVERTLFDEVPAISCDLCDFTFAVGTIHPNSGMPRPAEFPAGAGRMFRAKENVQEGRAYQPEEIRELCPTCMQGIWDDVTKRREKLLADRAAAEEAAKDQPF